jgi:hypothetical protein
MTQAYTIVRITEETGAEPGGMPAQYIRVDFKVGDDGPFVARMRKAQYKPELMRQHLEQFARDIQALRT